MALVVDCETVAIAGAEAYVQPARNLVDPEKIAANVAERVAAAALYPWTARIVALGWCHETDDVETVRLCNSEAAEATVLREFWAVVGHDRQDRLVTFNGRRYDLPLLMLRSMLLGVKYPMLNLDRYRSPHVDLLDTLTWNGVLDVRSLTWFAKRFGLDTSDAFSGKEVAQLYEDGNWDAIEAHCASDVRLTRQIAELIGVLKKRPVVAEWGV